MLVQYIYNDTEIDKSTFNVATFTPTVSANSPLRVVVDYLAGTTTWYTYDQFGQLEKTEKQNLVTAQTHDAFNRVESVSISFGGDNMSTAYTYASPTDDTLVAEETVWNMPGEISTTYSRDGLQRPTETTVMVDSNGYKQAFEYAPRQKRERVTNGQLVGGLPSFTWITTDLGTTNYVSAFKEYSVSGTTETLVRTDTVEYDANGNITKYGNVTYEYDNLNRLVRENNPTIDKTTIWSYDINGNITYVREYAYTTDASPSNGTTTAFIYGTSWKDQLSVISVGTTAKQITYDQAGNPTTYKGATLSWTRGRLLASYTPNGSTVERTLKYDANGVRCQKNTRAFDQDNITVYVYNGNNLISEYKVDEPSSQKTFLYNSQGVIGFVYQGVTYTYRKNLFGDIVAIYNGSTKVAEYIYDAWGNQKIMDGNSVEVADLTHIANVNPFRYRGYYWENDIQLYYLMSRYYDPQTGRFINADGLEYLDPESINGLNLYAYCGNNPIMYTDITGHSWESFWNSTGGKIVGTVLIIGAMVALSIATAGVGTAVVGALGGGFWAAVAGGAVGGAISGAIFGAGISMISQGVTNGYSNIDYGQVAIEGLIGMASGAATGALFAGIGRGLGLLGKTKWAQRTLKNYNGVSKNYMFGSKSGSFTFFRNGKVFRLEASLQHGLHYHSLAAGTTASQWQGIFKLVNSIAGLIGGSIGNGIY